MKFLGLNITRAQKKSLVAQSGARSNGSFSSSYLPASPFLAALNKLTSTGNYKKTPRECLELYNLMYECFPFFERAMTIHKDFMGCPYFESKDDVLKNELNDWAEELSIFIPGWDQMNDTGLENYVGRLLIDSYKTGAAFDEIRRVEEGIEVTGVTLACPESFNIIQEFNKWVLTFSGRNGTEYIREMGDLNMFTHDPLTKIPWGNAMGTGAEYFITNAIRFIESRVSFEERISNPTVVTLISPDMSFDPEKFGITKDDVDRQRKIMDDGQLAIREAHLHRMRTGKPSDITIAGALPTKIDNYSFGQGVMGGTNYPQILDQFLTNLHQVTDVPSTFLGINSSAGLGSDKFRVEKAFLELRAKSNRNRMERCVYNLSDNMLLGRKVNPKWLKSYDIIWQATNVEDDKLIADTEAVNATTFQQQLVNFSNALATAPNSDLANNYADEIGRPELKATGNQREPV